jgi:hypothetical protein
MLESYTEGGLKYIASLVKEEPDTEQYTKEVEKAKAKDRGEDRNDKNIAAGKVDAVKVVDEEVEELDELSKGTLADYAKKATHSARIKQKIAKDFEAGAQRARKPDMKAAGEELSKKYQRKAQKREEGVGKAIDRLAKEEVEQVDEVLDSAGKFMSYATKAAASGLKSAVTGTGKFRKRQAGIQRAVEKAKEKVNQEEVELDEREMTDAEMKKREEIVKSMKKGLSGFKQRYGDRAKDVMYATATKQAMKEENLEEAKASEAYLKNMSHPDYDKHSAEGAKHMSEPIGNESYVDNARMTKREILKQNPHKRGTMEHQAWHHGASDEADSHIDMLKGN